MSAPTIPADIDIPIPECIEYEHVILQSLIAFPVEIAAMFADRKMGAEHFFLPAHAETFTLLNAMHAEELPINALTVMRRLADTNRLQSLGGSHFVRSLFQDPIGGYQASGWYLDEIKKAAILRSLMSIGAYHASLAANRDGDALELVQSLQQQTSELIASYKIEPKDTKGHVLRQILTEIETGEEDSSHFVTGIVGLDEQLKMFKSDLICIAGPTGSGKSSLASQIVTSAARRGENCLWFSLEMSDKQCYKRVLADISGYNYDNARFLSKGKNGSPEDRAAAAAMLSSIADAVQPLISGNLNMSKGARTLDAIIAECREANKQRQLAIVLIDYAQIISIGGKKFGSRQQEIAHATQSLKRLASELGCIIILPSQVNQNGVSRESEDLEMDSNSVIKIAYDKETGTKRRVYISKQREGTSGVTLRLVWNGPLTRFETRDIDADDDDEPPKKKGWKK